ncbi:hypothetical protein G6F56_008251 [Rhizopus delemar]|nr:hypothetical protein G6F56_008251 [Rhizopus delemar]
MDVSLTPEQVQQSIEEIERDLRITPDLTTLHPSIHPSSQVPPTENLPVQEDVIMTESISNGSCSSTTPVQDDGMESLILQREIFYDLLETLNKQKASFIVDNNKDMLSKNKERILDATQALNDVKRLIEAHEVHKNNLKGKGKELHNSSPKKKTQIPSKEIPKFNVNPIASALYQLTQNESNKISSSTSSDLFLDMFLRDFERILTDYDIEVDIHWLLYLEISFEKSDNNGCFARYKVNNKN